VGAADAAERSRIRMPGTSSAISFVEHPRGERQQRDPDQPLPDK